MRAIDLDSTACIRASKENVVILQKRQNQLLIARLNFKKN